MAGDRYRDRYPAAPEPLPSPVADSHCHLDIAFGEAPTPDVSEALAKAADVGVTAIVQVGIDVPSSQWAAAAASEHEHVWAAVALHPNEAPQIYLEAGAAALEAQWAEIAELAALPQVRAVGETGMDFFRTAPELRAVQEESFRVHIDIAKRTGTTLVIHDRDAHDDVLRILDDAGAPDTVVLHCFSGDEAFAQAVTERGFYCSFAGNVTFKNAEMLRVALGVVPTELVLVETDAPFLTPVPNRGRPNASYQLPNTVRAVAQVRGWELSEACEVFLRNTERAFGPL